MKVSQSAILLASLVLLSAWAGVVLPSEDREVHAASFLPAALDELRQNNTFVLFDDQGFPYGFVQDGQFVNNIDYGELTVYPYEPDNSYVIGGSEIDQAARDIAKLRLDQGTEIDWQLLQHEDYLKYAYYSERYNSLEDFLTDGLGLDTKQESIDFLNSLEPELANEFLSIFEALESGQVSPSQYNQLLDTLNKMNQQDLSKYLDQEMLEQLDEMLDEIRQEVAEKVLDQILENLDKIDLDLLYKLLRQLDLSTIYEIARDYVREMARDGSLDQLGDALEGVEIPDSVKKSFANSATEFVKNKLWDMLPKNLNYYLLAFAVIILTFALRGVGG